MAQEVKVWPAVTIAALVNLILMFAIVSYAVPNEFTATVDFSKVNAKLDSLNANVIALAPIESETDSKIAPTIYLTKSEVEEEANEAKALELATEYINSKDFKKLVIEALGNENVIIKSHRDITKIVIRDYEVNEDGEDTNITFELKVYYFIDGDKDETGRALLEDITLTFEDFDYDDDFEDAEVNELSQTDVVVKKIYD